MPRSNTLPVEEVHLEDDKDLVKAPGGRLVPLGTPPLLNLPLLAFNPNHEVNLANFVYFQTLVLPIPTISGHATN